MFFLILLISIASADFRLDKVVVTISDINEEGAAHVQESLYFFVVGDYSRSLYDSGLYNNDLSFWATSTQITDMRFHINPNKVDLRDFRVRPQQLKKCNAFTNSCRGEIILDYIVYPSYKVKNQIGPLVNNTGLFIISKYKPRTSSFRINPEALSFAKGDFGDVIISKETSLRIILPKGNVVTELNPVPDGIEVTLPQVIEELTWTDTILVRFSLVFDVEESLDKEVAEFFTDLFKNAQLVLYGEHGIATLALVVVLVGSYIYLKSIQHKSNTKSS